MPRATAIIINNSSIIDFLPTGRLVLIIGFLVTLLHSPPLSAGSPDADILVKFKESLGNNGALSGWDPSGSPCDGSWVGVLCWNGTVRGIKLENKGLEGPLDVEPLSDLPSLVTLSLMNNNLDGSFPNLDKLNNRTIRAIYLSNNKFSGEIPADAFDGMTWLRSLHLANNQFSGPLPMSLLALPRLRVLKLEQNQFDGEIPNFPKDRLKRANFSNNNFAGPIPPGLQSFNATSFSGNKDICGGPMKACPDGTISIGTIIIIVVAVVAAIIAIAAAFIILRRCKQATANTTLQPRDQEDRTSSSAMLSQQASANKNNAAHDHNLDKMEQGHSPDHNSATRSSKNNNKSHDQQSGKLTFLRDDVDRFNLADLLRASAEILGSGVFGSTYKAALSSGQVVVVKRFRHMNNVGREEFQEHMGRLGKLRHPNLLPVVAFYYRKEEKLLVSEYNDNVSLAVHLHGNHSQGIPSLDWSTRLKIVKGVARGLLNLYNELPSLIAPHGHLKSSNVLLSKSYEPRLTDYGLVPITNQEHAQDLMIAYKSPEYKQFSRITKKTDVWSLGILILEILTGKFPANSLQQGKGSDTDLATWVNSVVRDEVTADVFDKDMAGYSKNSEGEMMKLLRIGLSCCEVDVEKRWDIKELVERIEEVREKDGDDDFYSSYSSEIDMHSSRGLSDDFTSHG